MQTQRILHGATLTTHFSDKENKYEVGKTWRRADLQDGEHVCKGVVEVNRAATACRRARVWRRRYLRQPQAGQPCADHARRQRYLLICQAYTLPHHAIKSSVSLMLGFAWYDFCACTRSRALT